MKVTEPPSSNSNDSSPAIDLKKLKALRRSPAMKLVASSPLLLKAYQLDMDCPPKLDEYVREQLIRLLRRRTAKALEPDQLFIRFTHDDQPAVEGDGRERYAKKLSLTELAVISFDVPAMLALMGSTLDDRVLDESFPEFTASDAMDLILNAPLATDYAALTRAFWARHEQTYCALAKLAFLHMLHTHYAQRKISLDGYRLGLDILGLTAFPENAECLESPATATRSSVSMLSLNGRRVAGAFQLKSHSTSHCFIHQPGSAAEPVEYISDDPQRMTHMLLNALNERGGPQAPDAAEDDNVLQVELSTLEGDIFAAITTVQKQLSLGYLLGDSVSTDWLKPIQPALKLISAIDLWQTRPTLLQRIPSPQKTAARLMRNVMKDEHGLDINPDQVFIRYIRGKSFTPLGSARVPVTQFNTPAGLPISLSRALIENYRVERAEGYPSGKILRDRQPA